MMGARRLGAEMMDDGHSVAPDWNGRSPEAPGWERGSSVAQGWDGGSTAALG